MHASCVRASGRLAACNVHVAPGLGNALGALYNAKYYGSPVIITAGQQEQGFSLSEPLLYDSLVRSPLITIRSGWRSATSRAKSTRRRGVPVTPTSPGGSFAFRRDSCAAMRS